MSLFVWVITVGSIVGVVLNIRKRRAGFAVWMVTNAGWVVYDVSIGAYEQALVFAVYFGCAVWGWVSWGAE